MSDNAKAFFQIQDEKSSENNATFFVQFNPKEFKLDESAGWTDGKSASDKTSSTAPTDALLTYDKGKPATVAMELIFDTTDKKQDVSKVWVDPLRSFLSATVDDKDGDSPTLRPPYCLFKWGSFSFSCVVEKLGITYLMFAVDGTPLRAKVSVSLKEREDQELRLSGGQQIVLTAMSSMLSAGSDSQRQDTQGNGAQTGQSQHSSSQQTGAATTQTVNANEYSPTTTYITQEGETLSDVAAKTGADFEDIAKANNVDNPMDIPPGTELVIPSSSQMAGVFEHLGKSEAPEAWGDFEGQLNGDSDLADMWDTTPGEYVWQEQEAEELGMEYTPYTGSGQAATFEHAESSPADSFSSQFESYTGSGGAQEDEEKGSPGGPQSR